MPALDLPAESTPQSTETAFIWLLTTGHIILITQKGTFSTLFLDTDIDDLNFVVILKLDYCYLPSGIPLFAFLSLAC